MGPCLKHKREQHFFYSEQQWRSVGGTALRSVLTVDQEVKESFHLPKILKSFTELGSDNMPHATGKAKAGELLSSRTI